MEDSERSHRGESIGRAELEINAEKREPIRDEKKITGVQQHLRVFSFFFFLGNLNNVLLI